MAWLKRRTRWFDNPPKHLGRRGVVLFILGIAWTLIGVANVTDPTGFADNSNGHLIHLGIDPRVRLAWWAVAGVLAIVYSFVPPRHSDAIGFAALVVPAAIRCASYGWGWLMYVIPGDDPGDSAGWVGALVWLCILAFIVTVAGWREPPPIPVHAGDDDG